MIIKYRGAICILLLLHGCTTHTNSAKRSGSAAGSTSWSESTPANVPRYKIQDNETVSGTNLETQVAPIYPPELLKACRSLVVVQAMLVVDSKGNVSSVKAENESVSGRDAALFISAIEFAVSKWKFDPLVVDRWDGNASDGERVLHSDSRPFSQGYLFRFICAGGKAIVTSNKSGK